MTEVIDRRKHIHASDIGPILGLSPYRTPFQVWQQKMGLVADHVDNKWTRLGRHLEPVVANMYAEETGLVVAPPRDGVYVNPEVPLAGSPDRIVSGPDGLRILEVKTAWTPRSAAAWGEPGTAEVPDHYRLQGVAYMSLLDIDRCDFAAMMNGEVKVYTIWRDRAMEAEILQRMADWWKAHVVADMPPPMNAEEIVDDLKERIKATNGQILEVGNAFDVEMASFMEYDRKIKEWEGIRDTHKANICAAISSADGIESPNYRATWKFANVGPKTDWAAVAAELKPPADLIAKHTKLGTPSRQFLLKEK